MLPTQSLARTALVLLASVAAGCTTPGSWPDPRKTASTPNAGPVGSIYVDVDHPPEESVVSDAELAFLAGRADAYATRIEGRDVVLLIDTSASTQQSALDPTAWKPYRITEPEPARTGSVLDFEVTAARALLRQIDWRRNRVGVVTFSGDLMPPEQWRRGVARLDEPSARTIVPLTHDQADIEEALEEVLRQGPRGMTHLSAGVERATAELVGGPESGSSPDPASQRVVVLLTDGFPTLPYLNHPEGNEREAASEAERAKKYGVRIICYAIGAEALERPTACMEIADRSGGRFIAVREVASLPEVLQEINYVGIEDLKVTNLTARRDSIAVRVNPDGTWETLVPVTTGRNEIRVTAVAPDGSTATKTIFLRAQATSRLPPLSERLVKRRGRIVDQAADEFAQHRRIELLAELRKEIDAARRRAAEQRRELDLEVNSQDGTSSYRVKERLERLK